jgi:hypothetical protein
VLERLLLTLASYPGERKAPAHKLPKYQDIWGHLQRQFYAQPLTGQWTSSNRRRATQKRLQVSLQPAD